VDYIIDPQLFIGGLRIADNPPKVDYVIDPQLFIGGLRIADNPPKVDYIIDPQLFIGGLRIADNPPKVDYIIDPQFLLGASEQLQPNNPKRVEYRQIQPVSGWCNLGVHCPRLKRRGSITVNSFGVF